MFNEKIFRKAYQFCMVPYCANTTQSAPAKQYISVPHDPDVRNKWLEAASRNAKDISPTAIIHCCGDHFDLPNDAENWDEFNLNPELTITLKPHVIPHLFHCQENRNLKRKTMSEAENILEEGIKVYKLDKAVLNVVNEEGLMDTDTNLNLQLEFVDVPDNNHLLYFENVPSTSKHVPIDNRTLKTKEKVRITFNNDNLPPEVMNRITAHIQLIKENSSFYVGIPEKHNYIIQLMSDDLNFDERDILLCLKKIRRDINILPLAHDFGVNKLSAFQCLQHLIPELARYFRNFIFWPKSHLIMKNLPRPFRKYHHNVESIISCLDITRREPQDNQTKYECWSSEQNKYMYRFLISSTPDGFVNFVSRRFGGSKSDYYLMEKSGYVDVVPPGVAIMINTGFSDVINLLFTKKCKIFWPTKVSRKRYDEEMNKSIVMKMYTEQIIKRFTEFLVVHPNTVLHDDMIPFIDDVVVVIAGLINLQHST